MIPEQPIRVLAFSGSLRKASYNTAALRSAQDLAPIDMTIEIFDLTEIPMYNEDVRTTELPSSVQRLRAAIADAHAILFATPEYNYSVPAVLKNALDWASRPPDQPFNNKPAAIIGVSTGNYGTSRAQSHLRLSCVYLNIHVINKPEVMITNADSKFDNGVVEDEPTRAVLKNALDALKQLTIRLRA